MSGIVVDGKFYENAYQICRECGHAVYDSGTPGYFYQCPKCDEDLFSFETDINSSDVLPPVTIAVVEQGCICFPFLSGGKARRFENQAEAEVFLLEEGAKTSELGSAFLFIELWEDGTPIVLHGEIIGGGKVSIEKLLNKQLATDFEMLRKENKEVHEAVIRKHKELMKIRMSLVTEVCPDCGHENTVEWSVVGKGYQIFCPNCGFSMMLCSECMLDSGYCDWESETSLCYRMVEGFWKNLEDVPFREDEAKSMVLEKDYRLMIGTREVTMFPAGTEREEIWHWFDERHPKGVAYLLYGEEKSDEDRAEKKE